MVQQEASLPINISYHLYVVMKKQKINNKKFFQGLLRILKHKSNRIDITQKCYNQLDLLVEVDMRCPISKVTYKLRRWLNVLHGMREGHF